MKIFISNGSDEISVKLTKNENYKVKRVLYDLMNEGYAFEDAEELVRDFNISDQKLYDSLSIEFENTSLYDELRKKYLKEK